MHVVLLTKPGHPETGVGRYASELERNLRALGHEVTLVHSAVPLPGWLVHWVRRRLGWDLEAFLQNYPIWARYPAADVYHLSSQNLATLMLFHRPPGRTVITVHDIIPRLTQHDVELRIYSHPLEEFADRLALRGLARADALVADSQYTARSLWVASIPQEVPVITVLLGAGRGPMPYANRLH